MLELKRRSKIRGYDLPAMAMSLEILLSSMRPRRRCEGNEGEKKKKMRTGEAQDIGKGKMCKRR